jgi:arabinoxylan arabinofuranohydrolase
MPASASAALRDGMTSIKLGAAPCRVWTFLTRCISVKHRSSGAPGAESDEIMIATLRRRQRLENLTGSKLAYAAAGAAFIATTLFPGAAAADNPIVQTNYTADPAPMLHDGRLYLYTSHDEDVTVNDFFTMNDWRLYSTLDMVNWTDHGSPASYKTMSWGTGDAWAPHGIARNGKFYLYVPVNNNTGAKIGVLVADKPEGPFTDPLGKALIATGSGNIDPTVYIDSDDQAYLYWGNPDLYYVKLNADMVSFAGSPTKVSLTTAGFGVRTKTDRATAYEEGPWFYKRDALYYLVFPADSTPEKLSYSTSSGPLGPWMFRGDIMAKQTGAGASFTNHPGVIDYKGHSFLFYHNGALPGGGGYKRSVCVEEFTYGADGSIPMVTMSTTGPKAVANLNPFKQVEAETIAFSSGLKTEVCTDTGGGMDVTSIGNGDYIKVKNVDFGTGANSFEARVATAGSGSIEIHLDSQTGTLLSTCAIASTGGAKMWATTTCTVAGATGLHDVFFKFTGSGNDLFNFNWWKFSGPGAMDPQHVDPTGGTGGTGSGGQATNPNGGTGGTAPNAGSATGGTGSGVAGRGGAPTSTGGSSTSSGGTGGTPGTTAGSSSVAGTGPVDTSDAGCDCRSSPGGKGTTPTLVALALLGVVLRRRRKE